MIRKALIVTYAAAITPWLEFYSTECPEPLAAEVSHNQTETEITIPNPTTIKSFNWQYPDNTTDFEFYADRTAEKPYATISSKIGPQIFVESFCGFTAQHADLYDIKTDLNNGKLFKTDESYIKIIRH